MYICPKCNSISDTPIYYCLNCGTKMVSAESHQQYQQHFEPKRPNNFGKKIPGIICGIIGFVLAIVGAFNSLLLSMMSQEVAITFVTFFAIDSLALSIVGLVLCRKCVKEGDTTSPARTVAGMSLAGIIITAFVLLIALISFT